MDFPLSKHVNSSRELELRFGGEQRAVCSRQLVDAGNVLRFCRFHPQALLAKSYQMFAPPMLHLLVFRPCEFSAFGFSGSFKSLSFSLSVTGQRSATGAASNFDDPQGSFQLASPASCIVHNWKFSLSGLVSWITLSELDFDLVLALISVVNSKPQFFSCCIGRVDSTYHEMDFVVLKEFLACFATFPMTRNSAHHM